MRPRSRKWKKWERGKKRLRLRQASAVFDNLCEIASSVFFFPTLCLRLHSELCSLQTWCFFSPRGWISRPLPLFCFETSPHISLQSESARAEALLASTQQRTVTAQLVAGRMVSVSASQRGCLIPSRPRGSKCPPPVRYKANKKLHQ